MPPALRPLFPEDLAEALPLVADAVPALRLTREDLERNLFEPAELGGSVQVAAVEDGVLAGVGCAALRRSARAPGLVGHIKLVAVRPDRRRRGWGGRILAELESWLEGRGAARVLTDGAAPVYLQPGVPEKAREALGFFARRGYRAVETRRSLVARIDAKGGALSRPAPPAPGDDVVIERARPDDREAIAASIAAGFPEEWAAEAALALGIEGASLHVARRGSELAGFAVAGLWARNAFGPMGTLPAFRGRGLGAALLERCLDDLRSRGEDRAVISWIGPEAFYRKLVAVEEALRFALLEKALLRRDG